MRVKLSASHDVEEIPGIIVQRLLDAKSKLSQMSKEKFNYFSTEDLLTQISDVRYELSDLDQMLDETYNIVAGYSSALDPSALEAIQEDNEEAVDEEKEI